MRNSRLYVLITFIFLLKPVQSKPIKIGLLRYSGGGDWYSVVDGIANLAKFCNQEIKTQFDTEYGIVEAGSPEIKNYPFILMTGHGNIVFNSTEVDNVRRYLLGGGFLFIDDDYGMDPYVKPLIKQIFPESELTEIPFSHAIFHQKFEFSSGFPKIHEHDNKPPKTYGIFQNGRLVLVYSTESNISDGWESYSVHKDPEEARTKALKMGSNLVQFAFGQ